MLSVSEIVVTAPSFGNVLKIFVKLPISAFMKPICITEVTVHLLFREGNKKEFRTASLLNQLFQPSNTIVVGRQISFEVNPLTLICYMFRPACRHPQTVNEIYFRTTVVIDCYTN